MKPPSLEPLLKDWASRLRMQDWDIKICYSDTIEDIYGRTRPRPHHKVAEIEINPVLPKSTPVCTDIEVTLVHELLHIKHTEWMTEEHYNQYTNSAQHEAFIEQMAQALVAAKRGLKRL